MRLLDQQISIKVEEAIKSKVFPGCVVGYVKKNGERQVLSFGNFTYNQSSQLVKEDTIYDTASLTKSIPTGSLALQLIDGGQLNCEDELIKNYLNIKINGNVMQAYCYRCETKLKVYECPICRDAYSYNNQHPIKLFNSKCCEENFVDRKCLGYD